MNAAPAPESLARYQVITTLGQGGMARVLLVLSRGPAGVDKLLVIKELKAELKGDPEFFTMFLDEARIAARLNHPNVIQTFEVVSDGEHPLIVMEYLEGQSLSQLVARIGRKAMPLDLHLHVQAQTATGLHYAHELRGFDGGLLEVVHRDVSPHNVFVTYDGLVKLVDFGIAKAADSSGLTRAGQFKGKVGYASPEQLGGGHGIVDRRTDVFALGVMLWEALAQRRLTLGEDQGAVMNRRRQGADPSIRDVAPGVPDELAAICEKAMAFDPDDRFATAADFRAALEGFLAADSRFGAGDLGALVSTAFAADREKIRGLVEARIRELAAGGPVSDFGPISFAPRSSQVSARVLATASSQSLPAVLPPAQAEPSDSTMKAAAANAAPPERRFGRTLIGVGVAVAVALTAMQLTRGNGASAVAGAASSTAAPGAAPPSAATVEVSISAEPKEARVLLDDVALATNPFRGAMPKSSLAHRLRIEAPGFASEERLVTLDRDLLLEFSLKPAPSATAAAPSPPHAHHGGGPLPPASAKAPPPGAPTVAPGESLANPARKKPRVIDTEL